MSPKRFNISYKNNNKRKCNMYKKVTTIEEYSDAPPFSGVSSNANQSGIKKYAPCVRVDVPLLIRLLEFAREEASSDLDLHALASRMSPYS